MQAQLDPETLRRIIAQMQASGVQPPGPPEPSVQGWSLGLSGPPPEVPFPEPDRQYVSPEMSSPPEPFVPPQVPLPRKSQKGIPWAGFELDPVTLMRRFPQEEAAALPPAAAPQSPAPVPLVKPGDTIGAPQAPPYAQKAAAFLPEFSGKSMDRELAGAQGGDPFSQEPFQVAADQESHEKRAKMLDMLAGFTEAGQNFSNNIRTSGEIMAGVEKNPEYTATGLRGAAAMQRDKVSPAQQDYYRSIGVNLPPGMTQGQLKQALPTIQNTQEFPLKEAALGRAQYNADRNAALRKEGLDIGRANLGERQMTTRRLKLSQEDSAIRQALQDNSKAQAAAMDVLQLTRDKANPMAIQASFAKMAKAAGDSGVLSNQDIERWSSYPGLQGFMQRLETFFTSEYPQETIDSIAKAAKEMLSLNQGRISGFLGSRRKRFETLNQGFEPTELDEIFSPGAAVPGYNLGGSASDGQWVEMINPETGKAEEMHPEDVGEAEQRGWRRR